MKKVIILIALMGWFGLSFGQNKTTTVRGAVVDSVESALPSATMMLLRAQDSVMHSFTASDGNGNFRFTRVPAGNYLLQISFMGFRNYSQNVAVESTAEELNLGNIILNEDNQLLDEVSILSDRIPIILKKDTIEYNAAAFKVQPNANVEELLKRLPGVEVDREGNVKAQGEDVNKVLVDGKEFFGDDPQIATKNLPADAVDKVQVFDKMSDMSEFTGIDDGNRNKTINLTLKDDKKKGVFGKLMAAYGTEDRWSGKASINKFTDKSQFSILASGNNTNTRNFSFGDYMNFAGGMQSLGGGGGMMITMDGAGGMSGNNGGIATSTSAGLNWNYDFSKKTSLNLSYFYNGIDNVLDQTSYRLDNLAGGQSLENSSEISQNTANMNNRLNFKLKHELSKFQNLQLSGSVSYNDGDFSSSAVSDVISNGLLSNQLTTGNNSTGNTFKINSNLIYRRKFQKNGRNFVVSSRINSANDDKDQFINSNSPFFPIDTRYTFSQNQLQATNDLDFGAVVSYTEPLGKKRYLEFSYEYSNNRNEFDKDFFDIDAVAGSRVENILLSSHYRRDYFYNRGGTTLMINKRKSNVTASLKFQSSQLDGEILSENVAPFSKTFQTLLPSLRWKYDFTTSKNLSFNYSTRLQEPSMTQLQPIVDNSNPLISYQGNPDLRAEYSHNAGVNFSLFDQFNFINLFGMVNARYTLDKITNSVTYDADFRQEILPVNVKNDLNLMGHSSFGAPLKFMGAKFDLMTNNSYGRSIVFVHGLEDNANRWSNSFKLSLQNRKKEHFDIEAGARYSFNNTNYEDPLNADQEFLTKLFYADFTLTAIEGLTLNTSFDYTIYEGDAFATNQEIPIWEASIGKTIFDSKRGELKLTAYDLLNKNAGINRTSNLNYIQETQSNALGRFFMLSFTYSLSAMSAHKGIDIHMDAR